MTAYDQTRRYGLPRTSTPTHPLVTDHLTSGLGVTLGREAAEQIARLTYPHPEAGGFRERLTDRLTGAQIVLTDPEDMQAHAESAEAAWDSWLAYDGDPDAIHDEHVDRDMEVRDA